MRTILNILAYIGLFVALAYALDIGMDREAQRMEIVKAYNCQHFNAC